MSFETCQVYARCAMTLSDPVPQVGMAVPWGFHSMEDMDMTLLDVG